MTEKENLALALDGKMPEWTPCFWTGAQIVLSSAAGNTPPFGAKEGYDRFGVHWTATENSGNQFTPTPGVDFVLTDITKWREQVKFPDVESVDWEAAAAADMAAFNIDRENNLVDYYHGNGLFERLHFLMGLEEASVALLTEPEEVYELVGAIADYHIAVAEKVAKYYKPDYYTFLDDYAHYNGLFISPDTFDEIFAPHLKRIIDFVNSTDMKFKMHCCGKVSMLLDNYYKIGVRRFDPCQPCNDLVAMKEKYPDIALMGGLDVQSVIDIADASEDAIRAEVRRCIDEYGSQGGYAIFGASVYMYDGASYAPGGRMGIVIDEAVRYAHSKVK